MMTNVQKINWPRITVVTPVYNHARYLESAILSVVTQGYPNLEHIVIDGGSTDGTLDIIKKYESRFYRWVSEPDGGIFDAMNKGFSWSTGEIMGYVGGTDLLHAGALRTVGSIFSAFPEVEWLTGHPTGLSEDGMTVTVPAKVPRWSRTRFLMGANQHIQAESTFWRRSLWQRAGGNYDFSLKSGGDFELWARFFRHARLYSACALIGGYRDHSDADGKRNQKRIKQIHDNVIEQECKRIVSAHGWLISIFRAFGKIILKIPKIRGVWLFFVRKALYEMPGPDLAPLIAYDYNSGNWQMKSK
ncbi:MAG: hypothetical protein A2Z83_05660 [Omnitrophica bacterium GWA2_52_8]|nr:MAG: hypothetical protein A2Z83_05660 [Omnitrophica bacterium GWA2_52_8]